MPPNYHGVSLMVLLESGQHHAGSLPADTVAAEQMLLVKSAQLEPEVPMGLLRELDLDTRGAPLSTHKATSQRAAEPGASSTSSYAFMSKPLKPKALLPSPGSSSSPSFLRSHTAVASSAQLWRRQALASSESTSQHPKLASGVGIKGTIGRSAFTPVTKRHKESLPTRLVCGGNGGRGGTGGVGETVSEGDTRRDGHADERVAGEMAAETGAMTAGRNGVQTPTPDLGS